MLRVLALLLLADAVAPASVALELPDSLLRHVAEASVRHEHAMRRHRHGTERRRRHTADQWRLAEDVAELAVCKFRVREDRHEDDSGVVTRVPASITEIVCRKHGCACMSEGEYRCTQITTTLSVAYLHAATGRVLEHERRDVRAGCVCAVKLGSVVTALGAAVDQ